MRLGLLGLIGFALLELWLLMRLSAVIGATATVLLVIVTAMVGIWLLRVEGLRTWLRASQRLEAGELPAEEVVEGGLLGVGAILLVLPGPLTDLLGLICVLPPTRRWLARSAVPRRMVRPFSGRPGSAAYRSPRDIPEQREPRRSNTIEGEYHRED